MEFFTLSNKVVFNKKDEQLGRFETICKVGSSNLLAFTSEIDVCSYQKGFFVYVQDINIPWCAYKVTSRKYPITSLEFDQSGLFLCVADAYGNVSVFTQKVLIDDWHEICSVVFPK
jgi:hypothetical protein